MTEAVEAAFAASRGRLEGLAYRMLGSRADAEDVLQDAYLRLSGTRHDDIRNLEGFLFTTVTRLCLDQLKRAHKQREVYVGPWLPEPILDADTLTADTAVEIADDLSFALLLTLEKLSAPERAAFLLHDVFECSYAQVAATLGKSETACRQLASRARKAVTGARPTQPASPAAHQALLESFSEAVVTGDTGRLEALLTADAVAYSDGGGNRLAALRPIFGADRVARFFAGLSRKHQRRGRSSSVSAAVINGLPGLVLHVDGVLEETISIDIDDHRIAAVYVVRNPEKLHAVQNVLAPPRPDVGAL